MDTFLSQSANSYSVLSHQLRVSRKYSDQTFNVSISINRLFLWKTDFYEVCKLANCSMTNIAIPIPGARVMQTLFTTFVCQ